MNEASWTWLVGHLPFGLAGGGHRSHGAAVVGPIPRDDLVSHCATSTRLQMVLASYLHGRFVGLGTARRQVDVGIEAQHLLNLVGKCDYRFARHDQGEEVQFGHLPVCDVCDLRPPIADVDAPQPCDAV